MDLMDELNLNVCVLDAGSFAEDISQAEVTRRTQAAILELQQNGLHVVVVNSHENLERLLAENTMGHDIQQCMLIRSYHDPSILDVLELVEHYDFSYYATTFDVDSICDWRAPPSTLNWLEKYREKLEVQCSFEADGHLRFIWPSQRMKSKWPVPKTAAASSKSTTFITSNGKSYYPPTMSESSGAVRQEVPVRLKPWLPPREEDIVRMSTGWISDSQREEQLEMAVLPHRARGSLQLVLAILGNDEKNILLQNASDMFQSLPMTDSKEEEDIQQLCSRGPWEEMPSHAIFVIGGALDGLCAVGAGSRKRARIRAAKVALAVAAKIGAGFEQERYSDMLHPLVERAKVLMEYARKVEVMQSATSWLTPEPDPWLAPEPDPVSAQPPSPSGKQPFLTADF